MTDSARFSRSTIALMAGALAPRDHVTHSDGRHCVAISPMFALNTFYLEGTLDELAQFALDLAGVVRELNDRELAATDPDEHLTAGSNFSPADLAGQYRTFDGTRAPVQAVVDELQARR